LIVGAAAMLWEGGHILLVGANELGWHGPYESATAWERWAKYWRGWSTRRFPPSTDSRSVPSWSPWCHRCAVATLLVERETLDARAGNPASGTFVV